MLHMTEPMVIKEKNHATYDSANGNQSENPCYIYIRQSQRGITMKTHATYNRDNGNQRENPYDL